MKCKYCKKGIIYKNNEWTHIKSNIPNCAGFMAEPENLSTSHNTDYDFGSEKEPQPKGKDASHPSHNH